jgi:WD40 repeat protein
LIATGGDDRKINIYNKKTNKLVKKLDCHTNAVRSLSFSKKGEYLVSGSLDMTVKVFKTKDWTII